MLEHRPSKRAHQPRKHFVALRMLRLTVRKDGDGSHELGMARIGGDLTSMTAVFLVGSTLVAVILDLRRCRYNRRWHSVIPNWLGDHR